MFNLTLSLITEWRFAVFVLVYLWDSCDFGYEMIVYDMSFIQYLNTFDVFVYMLRGLLLKLAKAEENAKLSAIQWAVNLRDEKMNRATWR